MDPVLVGIASVIIIVILIYCGSYVAITLSIVSFIGVWILRGDMTIAMRMMTLAVTDSIKSYDFASIPTFVMMGLIVGKAGIGTEIYEVFHHVFRRVRAGLGIATVAANAAFAAVTGSSIASASVFTRVSVPEMIRYDYGKRFAVGVVAGSSVLGMLIPPSVMLIIYAFVAEQSVGDMFLAGVVPGLLLASAFICAILVMTLVAPKFIGKGAFVTPAVEGDSTMSTLTMINKLAPLSLLIAIVLGGIYTGVVTAAEAGAAGALVAFLIAAVKGRMSFKAMKEVLIETGHITAAILFLIMSATMYSRMLGIAGLPSLFSDWLSQANLSFELMMVLYVILLIFLGTIIDTSSIILICAPLFLKTIEEMGLSLVWFGIITVVGAEIGLLTPPFGISCFVIRTALNRSDISLNDIFIGAAPFALVMLFVLILLIAFPPISLALL
ncbi:MAG: TRAP transporter large permease subunit [Pseudolabrys sp.]|nr:TRAP transporter large permease subunit [Pseudolabrys sp.]